MKKLEKIKTDFIELSLPIGLMIVAATENLDILFVNAMFAKMLGYENIDEFSKKSAMSAWDFVYKDDIENLRKLAADRIGKSDPYEIAYRVVKKDGAIVWVNQNSSHTYDENKNEIIFAYYTDITAQKQMEQDILAGKKKYEILINSIPGGVGMYKCNAEFKPIFISDRVYELCGMTKDEYCYATRNSTLDVFHPDDRQGLIDTVSAAYNENRKFGYTHRVLQKDGTYRWMRVSGQIIASPDGELILYAVFTDVHEQIKAEYALSESEFRYATAIKASNINIWEYNYDADTMTIFSKSPKINSKNLVIPQYTKSIIDDGHIREDSAAVFFDMLKALKNGADEITCDLWIRENKNDDFWCERVTYTNIFSEDGKPQKAYCIGHDVTKEKEAEKRYLDELSYREAMQKATMISINVNLTRNTILDYKSNFSQVTSHIQASKTAQEYFDQVYTELTTTDMRKKCMSVFNRESMLKSFANGQTTISMELTRKIEGRRYWTILTAHMMKKTEDNEIIAFLYSTNVTNEKTMQNVMNAIVKTDYDFLVVVDATRNSAVRYSQNDFGNDYAYESENFEEQTREYVKLFVCDDDIAHVVQEITLENILSNLDSHETYSIFYKVTDSDGRILHKQLRFSYINRELKSFLMTRVDITAAIKEQDKKNSELVTAVKMAEHANAAKSEFLSRISHEIRTPMNAVIGMSQIALNSLDDKALAAESIKKSLYASQYLLLLLGDILDMSKIESGNVTLKNELIVCRRFLDAIDTIITTQANAKGVTYIVNECENHEEGYFGDSVRVQQILINVLTNAIKFTPVGGTVYLDITQDLISNEKAMISFKISDTGIGISEDFLPNLFKPFSQEHNSSSSSYGGSGLGLAISKNLAVLMGGDIFVQSTLGEGTTFEVKIPLGIPANLKNMDAESDRLHLCDKYDFSGKRILLVEDHKLNVIVAKKILEYKNFAVDVAENGQIAVKMFSEAQENYYDAILMDIKMPVMDGLEASKEIRNLKLLWAKKVPIIAMSANAFQDDVDKSKNAGMNAHLAKPIDSELLYQTLHQLL